MPQAQVEVLEVIEVDLVEVEKTVGHGLQLVQDVAAVDAVSVAHVDVESRALLRPIVEVGIDRPIKFLPGEVEAYFRDDAQKAVALEKAVVLELLAVGDAVGAAITNQKRVDEGRAAHASHLVEVERIVAYEHVAHFSPKLQPLVARAFFAARTVARGVEIVVEHLLVRREGKRAQGVEGGRIPDVSIGVATQDVGRGQVVAALVRRLLFVERSHGRDFLVVRQGCVFAFYLVAQQGEASVHLAAKRQELVRRAHLSHLERDHSRKPFGATEEAYPADAPHVFRQHQTALHQLETLAAGDEAYQVFALVGRPPHGVHAIGVILRRIGGQRRKQLVVEQRGSIDVDVEVFGQAMIHLPKLRGGARNGAHPLVVAVGRGEVQVAVGFHHVFAHALAQAEDGGPEAEEEILLQDMDAPFDVQFRLVGAHGFFVHGREEDGARHQ